jgi:AcrR family transcriptional regulator
MSTPRSRHDRRDVVMSAAASLIRSASFDWFRGITYEDLERRTGIDRAQIARDFGSKSRLQLALVEHCLAQGSGGREFSDRMAEVATDVMADPEATCRDMIMAVGRLDEERGRDRRLFNQMAMWALAHEDPEVERRVRQLYRDNQEQYEEIFTTFTELLAERGFADRAGLEIGEVITLAVAISDGLALRAAFDPEAVTAGLTGRALVALTEAMVARPTPDGVAPSLGEGFALRLSGSTAS